jgi:hypothetical protein
MRVHGCSVYAGVPLTEIARNCGTSVRMIELHYAGVMPTGTGVDLQDKPSDGLEPSTPSLPWKCSTN